MANQILAIFTFLHGSLEGLFTSFSSITGFTKFTCSTSCAQFKTMVATTIKLGVTVISRRPILCSFVWASYATKMDPHHKNSLPNVYSKTKYQFYYSNYSEWWGICDVISKTNLGHKRSRGLLKVSFSSYRESTIYWYKAKLPIKWANIETGSNHNAWRRHRTHHPQSRTPRIVAGHQLQQSITWK